MSLHNFRVELSDEAKADTEDILLYTLLTWGLQQMQNYSDMLDRTLATIQENPHIGRPHVIEAYRCFPAGEHLILYRVENKTVFVVRILHSRMDLPRHLE
ncbi:type II toxin-antitoxin system RelE/ParE family toxin [Paraburkholderia sp. RL18-103-BIB-C]|uniref:type II toxin-antitoxin system RelE/ParE family toxin n=1 Tax=unclassified Paraburkholderia TaxID=2615204 RepID=UPI0038B9A7C6